MGDPDENLTTPAAFGENPRSIDRMTMTHLCRFLFEGVILKGVH